MPRKEKYYGTLTHVHYDILEKIKTLGYDGVHNQFRVVCKATSVAKANQIAESLGFMHKVFRPNYTSETGNLKEIEMCDKYGFIINISRMGDNYIPFSELIKGGKNENP